MTAPDNETAADPVTREIIRGKLLALADEMGIVIAKTSMSPVIYEVLDFACGLCDADGELVVQTNGIPLFTGTFAPQVRSIVRRHGGDHAARRRVHDQRPLRRRHPQL